MTRPLVFTEAGSRGQIVATMNLTLEAVEFFANYLPHDDEFTKEIQDWFYRELLPHVETTKEGDAG